jgi:hypothetical protein
MLKKLIKPKILVALVLLLALGFLVAQKIHTELRVALHMNGMFYGVMYALNLYADDHADALPALDSQQGCLAIPRSTLVPNYINGEWFDRILLRAEGDDAQAGLPNPVEACDCEKQAYYFVAHIPLFEDRDPDGAVPPFAEDDALRHEAQVRASTPLLIRRVPPTLEECDCLVLFLDGHMERLRYPLEFPCTQEVMQTLQDQEAALCRAAQL